MQVKEVMTTNIISVDKDEDLKHIMKMMKKHNITKIPVLEEKKLIGFITDSAIAVKLGSIRNRGVSAARLHASSVMDKELITISPDDDVQSILEKVGEPGPTILNVMKDDDLVGIVTKADLLPHVESKQMVRAIMKEILHSVSPDDRVIHARRIMIDNHIARLPVINNGMLIGMISDVDIAFSLERLKKLFPVGKQKHHLDELLVHDVMKTPVISADASTKIIDVAKLMIEHQIGAIPITEHNKIMGIVTRTDLLKTITISS